MILPVAAAAAQLPDTGARPAVTGLVLAGGQGLRMGGVDKGLLALDGAPLVSHVIARLRPQVDALLLSANRNRAHYEGFGHPVVADDDGGFAGPLAGIQAGLRVARTPLLAVVPCDAPRLPPDLVARLRAAWARSGRAALARAGGRRHPVFALLPVELAPALHAYLAGGARRVETFFASVGAVEVDFDDEAAFANLNTPADLSAFAPPPAGAAQGAA